MIHSREDLDKKLKARLPFFKGLWLLIRLIARFIWSLGPHNWSLQKLANAGKDDPLDQAKQTSTSTMNRLK